MTQTLTGSEIPTSAEAFLAYVNTDTMSKEGLVALAEICATLASMALWQKSVPGSDGTLTIDDGIIVIYGPGEFDPRSIGIDTEAYKEICWLLALNWSGWTYLTQAFASEALKKADPV